MEVVELILGFHDGVKMMADPFRGWHRGRRESKKKLNERIKEATDKNEAMKAEVRQLQSRLKAMKEQIKSGEGGQAQVATAKGLEAQIQKTQEAISRSIEAKSAPTNEEIIAAKEKLQYWKNCFHIAIAGGPGCGKSSLVNALRKMKDDAPAAAPVDCAGRGDVPTLYSAGEIRDKLVWGDAPGIASLDVPSWDYFKNQCLYLFDAIILIWDTRLMDSDIAILTHCRNLKIPCLVVRTKCDLILQTVEQEIKDEMGDPGPSKQQKKEYTDKFKLRYEQEITKFREDSKATFDKMCEEQQLPKHQLFLVCNRGIYRSLHTFSASTTDVTMLDEDEFLEALQRRTKKGVDYA
eukprot:Gregarina_sp_Pseudo_9__1174@NODE_1772_length_1338_cov_236_709007_g1641_i0_p1_GENE_NODE_1772_length_1338_cov_236_709007_g1641_i0NODE_1772_length_1338_cov_236_709007_g1641_i0_p1_ORF_typecomplete_len350_score63_36IIGP/PF05049_13/6_1e41FeoB_N/PF02421_18/3_3e09RsgA_GTPase/PF03193_16/1_5e05RsgA_GTPase/PF03193_16/5_9MMR_HSR1/PF01926_23/7_4e05ATP_bind_1/PF03029_17/7_9ATP_bind_1/PF03029_17/0_048MeaB/PF03308_16/5_8e02MeaB/PF03308_16/0_0011KAP_NTPase/PF07693_14/8_6e02KAP_NTPase/PF07693_14/0_0023AAA_15/PF13